MRAAVAIAALLAWLAGCASHTAPPPAPPRVVEVPVPVPCVEALPVAPAWAVDALALGAPVDAQMRALRAERHQRIGYEAVMLAALEACARDAVRAPVPSQSVHPAPRNPGSISPAATGSARASATTQPQ